MNKVYVVLAHDQSGHIVNVFGRKKDASVCHENMLSKGLHPQIIETEIVRNKQQKKVEAVNE